MTLAERARLAYQTIDAFGWDIRWKHDRAVPDDAWPRDIIERHMRDAVNAAPAAVMYEALKRAERVVAFDLNRMIVMGDDYNQAVRDAYDGIVAARRLYEDAGR